METFMKSAIALLTAVAFAMPVFAAEAKKEAPKAEVKKDAKAVEKKAEAKKAEAKK